MTPLILTVAAVILVSALCSLFEAVLYSVPISHVESLAEAKKPSGIALRKLREHVDRPITAILSLNTISNTAGAALAGALATRVFGADWFIAFSAFFTLSILMFSEILPKTAGVIYSRPLAGPVARPLQALVWLFRPLLYLSRLITKAVAGSRQADQISGEEIAVMARLGIREGVIAEGEGKVIENILSLESKTASEVMTPRTVLFTLDAELTVEEAHTREGVLTYSRVPIYLDSNENIVGIALRRDILSAVARDRLDVKLEELVQPVHFVLEKTNLSRVLRQFLERGEHLFVALDEFGGLAGVITLEDVMEEILGTEIVDESDRVTDLRELARKRREQVLSNTV
ncbi:MAG: HlyC/CorC family transporter [bacterium]|nr:HlyC/CorC family transporter [bacterium]